MAASSAGGVKDGGSSLGHHTESISLLLPYSQCLCAITQNNTVVRHLLLKRIFSDWTVSTVDALPLYSLPIDFSLRQEFECAVCCGHLRDTFPVSLGGLDHNQVFMFEIIHVMKVLLIIIYYNFKQMSLFNSKHNHFN